MEHVREHDRAVVIFRERLLVVVERGRRGAGTCKIHAFFGRVEAVDLRERAHQEVGQVADAAAEIEDRTGGGPEDPLEHLLFVDREVLGVLAARRDALRVHVGVAARKRVELGLVLRIVGLCHRAEVVAHVPPSAAPADGAPAQVYT